MVNKTNGRQKKAVSIILILALLAGFFVFHRAPVISYAETGFVNTEKLNLRTGPGTGYASAGLLSGNSKVSITGQVNGSDGYTWYKVTTGIGDGYLRSDFVNLQVIHALSDAEFENSLAAQGFPESYKNDLRGLHEKYPNWVFLAQHTGLDWNTVIAEESKTGRNLVEDNMDSSWKSTAEGAFDWERNSWPGFDGEHWVAASEGIIRYYMDPRNFLNDPYIFQFELQTYDPSRQTREGLESLVAGTFLGNTSVNGGKSFSGGSTYGPGYSSAQNSSAVTDSSVGNTGSSAAGTIQNSTTGSAPAPSGEMSTQNSAPASSGASNGSLPSSLESFTKSAVETLPLSGSLFGGFLSYAAWEKRTEGWVYTENNGTLRKNGWYWIDGNNDGVSECYFFDQNGIMAFDTVISGYTVNTDGQWTENGRVVTKSAGPSAISAGNTGVSYVDLLLQAAEASGVSPYVLASMILQEQGLAGESPLISGTYRGYEGYYNFYNLAAYAHDGMNQIEAGLSYAKESGNGDRPWNSVSRAIIGGAKAFGANYTDSGQDTFYLKKFNVQGTNKYNHQYMTNVPAAADEASFVSKAYTDAVKSSTLVFKIPVYENMPAEKSEMPQGTGNPNNKLSSLSVSGFSLTPTFDLNTSEYTLIVGENTSTVSIEAYPIDRKAVVSGTGVCNLAYGVNTIDLRVTAENGAERLYHLKITRKNGAGSPLPAAPSADLPVDSGSISIENSGGVSISHGEAAVVISGPPI